MQGERDESVPEFVKIWTIILSLQKKKYSRSSVNNSKGRDCLWKLVL